jgi:hypothetical protein
MGGLTDAEREGVDDAYISRTGSGLIEEAALFASPLPMVGKERITTRKELWVSSCKYHTECNTAYF